MRLGPDASLLAVERVVEEGLVRECRAYNQRKPLITVIAHELNSRAAPAAYAEAVQRASARMAQSEGRLAPGTHQSWLLLTPWECVLCSTSISNLLFPYH